MYTYTNNGLKGLLPSIARILLVLSIPLSIIWLPFINLTGLGNMSANDSILILLWPLTFFYYLTCKKNMFIDYYLVRIISLVLLLACLSAFGSFYFIGESGPGAEFSIFMKRFGTSSIIPLAMYTFCSRSLIRWSKYILLLSMVALCCFTLFPELQLYLPISSLNPEIDPISFSDRATGLISNPNDLAYFTTLALAGIICLARIDNVDRIKNSITIIFSALISFPSIIYSGSRSGMLGLLAGCMFYIFKSHAALKIKIAFIVLMGMSGWYGWQISPVFSSRFESIYIYKLGEDNVLSRVQAQYVAVLSAVENPLGVGYGNFRDATEEISQGMMFPYVEGSDSAYFDTLLGTGFIGLVVLIVLFRKCWKYIKSSENADYHSSIVLQSAFLSVLFFATSSITPISVFLSPVFFFIVGSSAYVNFCCTVE